MDISSILPVL